MQTETVNYEADCSYLATESVGSPVCSFCRQHNSFCRRTLFLKRLSNSFERNMGSNRLALFFQTHTLGRHLGFWALVYLTFVITNSTSGTGSTSILQNLVSNLIHMPAHLLAAYSLNYVLIPNLYRKRRHILFVLLFLVSAYLISILDRFLNVYAIEPLFREGDFKQETAYQLFTQIDQLLESYFPRLYLVALAMTLIRISNENTRMREVNLKLANEKTTTELNFLKAQLNPHFLFNTLNNLYSLAIQKSDKAPDAIATLSEILDYTIYQSQSTVNVEEEAQAIRSYIKLEQLRYGAALNVKFAEHIEKSGVQIYPLLFLSIVENAFKHGTGHTSTNPEIVIDLTVSAEFVRFMVKNSKGVANNKSSNKKGIGVANIKKQLAILYPEHSYEVKETEKSYQVDVRIELPRP
ncbi:MAG: sensor histidine kinase [Ekhidna sp.]|nr:sensor histidine kinase [Ekhidna sp.]